MFSPDKKPFLSSVLLLLLVVSPTLVALAEPAFEGAVGFGSDTRAGRGGQVIRVTTLDARGPGSLHAAIETAGPRVVVFEVGGVIDLAKSSLAISEPFLTIAGQTAPEPGITIIKGGLSIRTHDVVIRHIRIRPGDAGEAKRSGFEPDGISTSGGQAYNIVIDHCSITWAVDENLSASGARTEGPDQTSHRITFSNNIIAEALSDSSHAKGPHSKGSLIHDYCREISIIGNLYAHNEDRNPYFKAFTTGVVANNLIYNPGRWAVQMTWVPSEWKDTGITPENGRISVVNNVFVFGADTPANLALVSPRGDAFIEGNEIVRDGTTTPRMAARGIRILDEKPVWPENLQAIATKKVVASVMRNVGARPALRDSIDARIVQDFIDRKGRIIDSQEQVGGYPQSEPVYRKLDVPENVDAWLNMHARRVEGR